MRIKNGFTLIEVLISISILTILSFMGAWYFGSATLDQALSKDRQSLVSLLSEARSLSLSSKDADVYGVHIEESQVVMFKGSSYSANNTDNIPYQFNSAVHVLSHSLMSGGDDIVFSRLKGTVDNFGTIVLALRNDSLSSITVTVKNTGVIE